MCLFDNSQTSYLIMRYLYVTSFRSLLREARGSIPHTTQPRKAHQKTTVVESSIRRQAIIKIPLKITKNENIDVTVKKSFEVFFKIIYKL